MQNEFSSSRATTYRDIISLNLGLIASGDSIGIPETQYQAMLASSKRSDADHDDLISIFIPPGQSGVNQLGNVFSAYEKDNAKYKEIYLQVKEIYNALPSEVQKAVYPKTASATVEATTSNLNPPEKDTNNSTKKAVIPKGQTPLMTAIIGKKHNKVIEILDDSVKKAGYKKTVSSTVGTKKASSADLYAIDSKGLTPMCHAVIHNNMTDAKRLIEYGYNLYKCRDNNLSELERLFNHATETQIQNLIRALPIEYDFAKNTFVENGMVLKTNDTIENTSMIDFAIKKNMPNLVIQITNKSRNVDPLKLIQYALKKNHPDIARLAIGKIKDINVINDLLKNSKMNEFQSELKKQLIQIASDPNTDIYKCSKEPYPLEVIFKNLSETQISEILKALPDDHDFDKKLFSPRTVLNTTHDITMLDYALKYNKPMAFAYILSKVKKHETIDRIEGSEEHLANMSDLQKNSKTPPNYLKQLHARRSEITNTSTMFQGLASAVQSNNDKFVDYCNNQTVEKGSFLAIDIIKNNFKDIDLSSIDTQLNNNGLNDKIKTALTDKMLDVIKEKLDNGEGESNQGKGKGKDTTSPVSLAELYTSLMNSKAPDLDKHELTTALIDHIAKDKTPSEAQKTRLLGMLEAYSKNNGINDKLDFKNNPNATWYSPFKSSIATLLYRNHIADFKDPNNEKSFIGKPSLLCRMLWKAPKIEDKLPPLKGGASVAPATAGDLKNTGRKQQNTAPLQPASVTQTHQKRNSDSSGPGH